MKTANALIRRNVRLFFKDKGMFFTSLITPVILLVLYVTFLGNVFRDSFEAHLAGDIAISEKLMNALVAGQLTASILAVSCVTVSFCSNFLMVQDKTNGSRKDLTIAPVKPWVLSLSYYVASLISSLIICLTAAAVCLIYVAIAGWYMSLSHVLFLLLDVVLLVLFGTALSSVINFFLSTQGQISAVGTVISSGYGFLCGAYMPLASFSEGLQRVLMFLPGTYGTALVRNHAMAGPLAQMEKEGVPGQILESVKDGLDCNLYFFGKQVELPAMYLILVLTIGLLVGLYILMNLQKKR